VTCLSPAFPWSWLFYGSLACFIVGTVLLVGYCDDQNRIVCEGKGGEYVHVYKGSLCVKPSTVLE
jgi:hypothetical protein